MWKYSKMKKNKSESLAFKAFREFLRQMLSASTHANGVSSKRVAGFMGWLVCIFICIYCTVYVIQAPLIIETLFYCTAGLLGLDTVTEIWKGKKPVPPTEPEKEQEEITSTECSKKFNDLED